MNNPRIKSTTQEVYQSVPVMKQVHITSDGKRFEDINKALDHQSNLDKFHDFWSSHVYETSFTTDGDTEYCIFIPYGQLNESVNILKSCYTITKPLREGFNICWLIDGQLGIYPKRTYSGYLEALTAEIERYEKFIRNHS